MAATKADILARYLFDLADKIDDLSMSDIAQDVGTFEVEDYGTLTSTLLDAAYWILADELSPELKDDPAGVDFYVNSCVYNDLLYRGYTPEWAWDESGLGQVFDLPTDASTKKASDLQPGDYVVLDTERGTRAGMMISTDRMFAFDGTKDLIATTAQKISKQEAYDLMVAHRDDIVASWQAKFEPKHS